MFFEAQDRRSCSPLVIVQHECLARDQMKINHTLEPAMWPGLLVVETSFSTIIT